MSTQFNPKDKIIVLDFDHTCYDTDDFLLVEIRCPMLSRFDIPVDAWEQSYRRAADIGYSLEQHLEELIKIMKVVPCSVDEIKNFGEGINFNKYLYPDVLDFLKEAKEKGYKTMILSFGTTSWQNKKIFGAELDKIVDLIKYVTVNENKSKLESIKQYAENCSKIIYIDNKGSNLDSVKKELSQVETYLINRVPNDAMNFGGDDQIRIKYLESRKIAESKTIFTHKNCHSFKEIILD